MKKKVILKIEEGLSLCEPDLSHVKVLFEILEKDRDYMEQWISWAINVKDVRGVENLIQEARLYNEGGQKFSTVIFFNDEFMGMMGLNRIDKSNRKAELGYWLKKEAQGQGLIQRCMPALLEHSFKELEINRVQLIIGTENQKSRSTAENCGYLCEGTLRDYFFHQEKYHDAYVFSKLQSDSRW